MSIMEIYYTTFPAKYRYIHTCAGSLDAKIGKYKSNCNTLGTHYLNSAYTFKYIIGTEIHSCRITQDIPYISIQKWNYMVQISLLLWNNHNIKVIDYNLH